MSLVVGTIRVEESQSLECGMGRGPVCSGSCVIPFIQNLVLGVGADTTVVHEGMYIMAESAKV